MHAFSDDAFSINTLVDENEGIVFMLTVDDRKDAYG